MRELLASRLELDVALIEPDHRLLNDLHLNSIAVGQIVVEAARLLGRMPPVVPTNFAVATVAEAASTLEAATLLAGDANEQFPAGVDTWIRCFATQYEERQIPAQTNEVPRNWRCSPPRAVRLPNLCRVCCNETTNRRRAWRFASPNFQQSKTRGCCSPRHVARSPAQREPCCSHCTRVAAALPLRAAFPLSIQTCAF